VPSSRTIRIDDEVWAELQQRARPLEDTPNSVLRRVFGLPEKELRSDNSKLRIGKLLDLVQGSSGQPVQLHAHRKGYAIVGQSNKVLAHIQPEAERLRVAAIKAEVERHGLGGWEAEQQDQYLNCNTVIWYVEDGDDTAYCNVAAAIRKLCALDN
jgi:hypothetical protein